jgi:hypothetical protein
MNRVEYVCIEDTDKAITKLPRVMKLALKMRRNSPNSPTWRKIYEKSSIPEQLRSIAKDWEEEEMQGEEIDCRGLVIFLRIVKDAG